MIIDILHKYDQWITLYINSLYSPFTDNIMLLLSRKDVWFPMYAIMLYFLIRRLGIKNGIIVIISIILTIVACDQTSNLIKYLVGRLRPCYNTDMLFNGLRVLEGRSNHFGFFSAHAANAFGLAISSIKGFKNDKNNTYKTFTYGIIIWAVLVSISRVFVGKHYFGDIVIGAMIGYCYGALFGYIASTIINRANKSGLYYKNRL